MENSQVFRPPLIWNVSTDGSKGSSIALHTVVDNLFLKDDKLVVSHIFDAGKTYLPAYLKQDQLQTTIETYLLGKLNLDQFKLEFRARDHK